MKHPKGVIGRTAVRDADRVGRSLKTACDPPMDAILSTGNYRLHGHDGGRATPEIRLAYLEYAEGDALLASVSEKRTSRNPKIG